MRKVVLSPRRDVGHDPDYRFSLANERTFLAWIRTALALDAGGVAVVQLLPQLVIPWAREALGVALVLMGGAVAAASVVRWARNEEALRTETPLPASRLPVVLTVSLIVVSFAAVVLLLVSGGG